MPGDRAQFVRNCNGNLESVQGVPSTPSFFLFGTNNHGPQIPGNPVIGGANGRYSSKGTYAIPAYDGNNRIQLQDFDLSAQAYSAHGVPTPQTFDSTQHDGDFAAGGRGGNQGVAFYLTILQPTGKKDNNGNPIFAHQLWVFDATGTWTQATGVTDPARVWASDVNPKLAFAFETASNSAFVTTDGVTFVRNNLLSQLLTANGTFFGNDNPMTTVGFSAIRPNVIAVGTTRNGILVTSDSGQSWAVVDAMPTPNGGAVAIDFDDNAPPATNSLVAAGGQGVWAVTLRAPILALTGTKSSVNAKLSNFNHLPIPHVPLEVAVISPLILANLPPLPPSPPPLLGSGSVEPTPVTQPPPGTTTANGTSVLPSVQQVGIPPHDRSGIVLAFTTKAKTDANGELHFHLPHLPSGLPSGQYFVQVSYGGDANNWPVFSELAVHFDAVPHQDGGSDGGDDESEGDDEDDGGSHGGS